MACLAPSSSSDLASFLSSLLPRGFAVGPSQLSEGRLGLWWVGRPLEAGSLLGKKGDAVWTASCLSEPGDLETGSSEQEKVTEPSNKTGCHLEYLFHYEWS